MTLYEFVRRYCTGRKYDSCTNSPCRYASANGCRHPLHPKNRERRFMIYCHLCESNRLSNYRLYRRVETYTRRISDGAKLRVSRRTGGLLARCSARGCTNASGAKRPEKANATTASASVTGL